jgi:predicted small secreted protein
MDRQTMPDHIGSASCHRRRCLAANFLRSDVLAKGYLIMRKNISLALTLLALIGLAPMLGACHTTAGAGQDLSAGGHALTNSAEKHSP